MTKKAIRRSGVVLDREQFDYQLAIRACTSRKLAQIAGVHEVLVSRARHGHPITEQSLRRITKALVRIPLHPGAELLVARPKGTAAQVKTNASPLMAKKEVSGGTRQTSGRA